MIQITNNETSFIVTLDRTHSNFKEVYIVISSLLGAYEKEYNVWSLDYDDFLLMKKKLDLLNLTEGRTIDESSWELLEEYQAAEKFNESLKNGDYNDRIRQALVGKIKTELYEDQLSGVAYLSSNRRAACLDPMGLGKTFEVLATTALLSEEIQKTLVIAPLQVLLDFEAQIRQHTYFKPLIIPAGRAKAEEFLRKNKDGDWDILLVHPENLVNSSKGNYNPRSPVTEMLIRMRFDMILVDEFHLYKNMEAKRSQCVLTLLTQVKNHKGNLPRAVPMTGTLVSESPSNAYMFLQIMGNSLPTLAKFEKYFTIFKTIPLKRKNPRTGHMRIIQIEKVVGYKNLDVLRDRIERFSIRRTKEDLKGFPDQVFTTKLVPLKGKQKTLYKSLVKGILDELPDNVDVDEFLKPDGKSIRLRQILNHPAILEEDGDSAKYEELDNILEQILSDPQQKVVVWTEYRAAVDLLHDRYNKLYGVQKLYGGVNITEDLKKEFVEGSKIRIAACIPAKAGTGVDFLARARTAIYVDRPYSLTLYKQSLDRIHRRVKTEGELSWLDKIRSQPATIVYLEVEDSIDQLVKERLETKGVMSETTLTTKKKRMKKKDLRRFMK